METMDLEGSKELFYMGNMEVVDEVYYWTGMVYNLARKGKEIHYEVSEAKEDYRISKVYNLVILMFMFYEENQVEKEHVKMLYKGPVEDKVEMLEDDVVNMVSPVLCEDDKSRNQKSSFLVHLKVSEDSQEKTGGCTTTQWFGILASTDGMKTMQDCDWSSLEAWRGSL